MPENGITVHQEGQEDLFLDLAEFQANQFAQFVDAVTRIPQRPERPAPQEVITSRGSKHDAYEDNNTLEEISLNLAQLSKHDRALVCALIDLISAAHQTPETQGNWLYEAISTLLYEVTVDGPFKPNELDPRTSLASVASDIALFWSWVNGARGIRERHPDLFPGAPAEPEAAPETSGKGPTIASIESSLKNVKEAAINLRRELADAKKAAKAPRARKPRKVSHAA